MLIYNYIIASILFLIFINFIVNIILFKNIKNYSLPDDVLRNPPLISILIPARNEELNIKRCVNSLRKQDYKNIEILVLNDNSIDNTAAIVEEISLKDSRVKLINGAPLKKGWLGKCWACFQLSKYAKGDFLIFTDADTLHYRDTVSKAFAALLKNKLDGISVYPKQISVTFHERMTVPFINFAILSFMPLVLVKYAKGGFFSTGIGQFFMFKKDVYEKMGGHESVKSEILEDIHLSKQIKKCGFRYMVFNGSKNIYCRMYNNFSEVVNGFTKFIYAAFNYNGFMEFLAVTAFSVFFLFPFLLLPLNLLIYGLSNIIITINVIQILLILTIKAILYMKFKGRVLDSLLMPISTTYMLLIAVNSYVKAKSKKGLYWKGRSYNVKNVDEENEIGLIKDYHNIKY